MAWKELFYQNCKGIRRIRREEMIFLPLLFRSICCHIIFTLHLSSLLKGRLDARHSWRIWINLKENNWKSNPKLPKTEVDWFVWQVEDNYDFQQIVDRFDVRNRLWEIPISSGMHFRQVGLILSSTPEVRKASDAVESVGEDMRSKAETTLCWISKLNQLFAG